MAKILLAEDEFMVRLTLSELLIDVGHQVIEASDGTQALELVEPDVAIIVSDLMMPRMGGAEWVAAVRKKPGMEEIPVIFMSALPPSPEARALASVFLAKPFRLDTLVETVHQLLKGIE
ncbi:response regulator [Azospirillum himalayense]|uniref:Response regulator n=1 Tax=Azospirillum himalayense TaxID=654847 RepID=A0ABW0GAN0_9PROT